MKGTPENPKDEYQQIMINAMSEYRIIYGYFDVTKDPGLREQLKDYTN
jgi:glutaredoxin-related protein